MQFKINKILCSHAWCFICLTVCRLSFRLQLHAHTHKSTIGVFVKRTLLFNPIVAYNNKYQYLRQYTSSVLLNDASEKFAIKNEIIKMAQSKLKSARKNCDHVHTNQANTMNLPCAQYELNHYKCISIVYIHIDVYRPMYICILVNKMWKRLEKRKNANKWKNLAKQMAAQVLSLTRQINGSCGVQLFNCQSHFLFHVLCTFFAALFSTIFSFNIRMISIVECLLLEIWIRL